MFAPPTFIHTGCNVFHLPGKVPEGGGSADERASSRNRTSRRNINATTSARKVQSYSPVPLPDSPSLKPYLQNVNQEHREPNSVDGGEFNHDWQPVDGEGKEQTQLRDI